MNKTDLSIATMTWARDAGEERLLRASLRELASLQVPVYITDGGSSAGFIDFLKNIPHFILMEATAPGLWGQVKSSLLGAYKAGSGFILYTEPDKHDFFQQGLPQMLEDLAIDERSGIITAARTFEAFETFPAFQQMTESTINNCCREITGNPGDYTYGPFLLNRHLVPHLENLQADLGWGWRPFVFIIARRLGLTINAYTGDFYCPAAQRRDELKERIYRMRQLAENIEGIVLAAGMPLTGLSPLF